MNAFGVDMTVLCALSGKPILLINIRSAGIDDYFAADFKFLTVSCIPEFSFPFSQ